MTNYISNFHLKLRLLKICFLSPSHFLRTSFFSPSAHLCAVTYMTDCDVKQPYSPHLSVTAYDIAIHPQMVRSNPTAWQSGPASLKDRKSCPLFNIRFPDFSRSCFYISQWQSVAIFNMKSYRSSSTFVTVDLLFHESLPFVQNLFLGFPLLYFHIYELKLVRVFSLKNYGWSSTSVTLIYW